MEEEYLDLEEAGGAAREGRKARYYPRDQQKSRGKCTFCESKVTRIDYKEADLLRRFITDRGKIRPQRQTGLCARHQRQVAVAIKRARHMALLPFVVELGPNR